MIIIDNGLLLLHREGLRRVWQHRRCEVDSPLWSTTRLATSWLRSGFFPVFCDEVGCTLVFYSGSHRSTRSHNIRTYMDIHNMVYQGNSLTQTLSKDSPNLKTIHISRSLQCSRLQHNLDELFFRSEHSIMFQILLS